MSISAHPQTLLTRYLTTLNGAAPNSAAAAVYASLDQVRTVAPSVAAAIINEVDAVEEEAATLARNLFGADHAYVQPHSGADANLVAFLTILSATVQRPLLTELGQEDPSKVSGEEWAKIRAAVHNQRLLSLNYYSGGHLTHGYRHNISSHLFDVYTYSVDPQTYRIELDQLRRQLHEFVH